MSRFLIPSPLASASVSSTTSTIRTDFYREEFIKHQQCLERQREYYSDRTIKEVEAALARIIGQLLPAGACAGRRLRQLAAWVVVSPRRKDDTNGRRTRWLSLTTESAIEHLLSSRMKPHGGAARTVGKVICRLGSRMTRRGSRAQQSSR